MRAKLAELDERLVILVQGMKLPKVDPALEAAYWEARNERFGVSDELHRIGAEKAEEHLKALEASEGAAYITPAQANFLGRSAVHADNAPAIIEVVSGVDYRAVE